MTLASRKNSSLFGILAGDGAVRLAIVNHGPLPGDSAKEFASYRQDLIVGVSLQVSAPLGQYDASKLLNLGNNRWSFKPELGISKALGSWIVEVAAGALFFTNNADFFNGSTFAQEPIFTLQGHVIYNFPSGIWVALDGLYFTGGRTVVNGVRGDNLQTNTRAGVNLALPVDRNNSIKLSAGTGITSLTGSQFSTIAIAWQYRWVRDIEVAGISAVARAAQRHAQVPPFLVGSSAKVPGQERGGQSASVAAQ